MKTKTIIKLAFAVALAFTVTFTGCKKDKAEEKPLTGGKGQTGIPHLVEMQQGITTFRFNYNNYGYLSFFKLSSENYTQEYHFGYEGTSNQPVTGVYGDQELFFNYNGDQLDKIEYRKAGNAANPVLSYTKFIYTDGKVSQKLDYYRIEGDMQPWGKTVYVYYPDGDLKTETYSYLGTKPDQYSLVELSEYEYDNKSAALVAPDELYYVLGIPKAKHNLKKHTTYNLDNELDETKSYSLNYNAFNLPINGVENTTYPNSPAINKNLKYSYQ